MEVMVYSLLWVMQDLYHQPKGLGHRAYGFGFIGFQETLDEVLAPSTF